MARTATRSIFPVLAAFVLGSCIFTSDTGTGSASTESVLVFRSGAEELRLPSLQVAQDVYEDVVLRLSQDGAWQLTRVGPMRPLAAGESVQAVLTSGNTAVLDTNWRPVEAVIAIKRIHIDTRVFGDVSLRLAGERWFWGDALQAGNDAHDLQELKALTLADFRANVALAATEDHHTVLNSHPESGTQSFPLRLTAKSYRFCMGRQDDGADSIRLLDAAGNAVVSMRAGDACAEVELPAGTYTMQHTYGGSGSRRMVFIRPPAVEAVSSSRAKPAGVLLGAQDAAYPEYWAVYVPPSAIHAGGFLSFNGLNDPHYGCVGAIDAAAQLVPYARTGEVPASRHLFDSHNFFLVDRNADGMPRRFSYPLTCPANDQARLSTYYFGGPLLLFLPGPEFPTIYGTVAALDITPSGSTFHLSSSYDDEGSIYTYYAGFFSATVMSPMTANALKQEVAQLYNSPRNYDTYSPGALRFVGQSPRYGDQFRMALRLFPKGLPPSWKDYDGNWVLERGEAALFKGAGCTGAAMIVKDVDLTAPQVSGDIGTFDGSLQLGPNVVARIRKGSLPPRVVNQSGCLDRQFDPAQESIELTVSVTINVETNSCEYCNLAGIDLSNQLTALKGVKLQHANLAGADFSDSDLSRADLRYATLQGANLANANLEAANLCQASLNGPTLPNKSSGLAAQLPGAHLKNANLAGANLDGANFASASFYSSKPGSCQSPCSDAYAQPSCASAYQAGMSGTDFSNAYLANVDMSGAVGSGTKFTGAILFGARLVGAHLSPDATNGAATNFSYAFLQGANFANASLKYVNFDSAYVDADSGNDCMQVKLRNELTGFPGYTSPTASVPVSCLARGNPTTDATIPSCVTATYAPGISRPPTDATNICPDGSKHAGGCAEAAWTSPRIRADNASQPSRTCQAKLCNPFTENSCWNAQN